MRSSKPLSTGLRKCAKCQEEDDGTRPIHRPRSWKEEERRREKELKRTHWHKNKPGQVSAPLILDPTAGDMSKEMKSV